MKKKPIVFIIVIIFLLLTSVFSHAASVSVSVSVDGGAVNATVTGSFASCTTCDSNGQHCVTNNSGSVALYLDNGYYALCSNGGSGGASCTYTLDRGSLNGTHIFTGKAFDCTGNVSDNYTLTLDNTPTVSVASPSGSGISAPFDITASAIFKPTLSATKGSISCSWGVAGSTYEYGLGSKSCTSESCSFSYAELTGRLFDLSTGSYWVKCYAYGGGSSANDNKSFSVDKTPTIQVTSPPGGATLSAPFDITASATFKPTLSATKGSISCSWGSSSSTYSYGLGSKSCTSESCSFSYAELTDSLFDLSTGSYWVKCYAYGGGSSASESKSFSVDKPPTIQVTSPPGGATLSAPFDITASATFKPTLSATKGSISCSWGSSSSTYSYGLGSKSCTNESCTFSYAELTGSLFDLSTGSYWVQCWAYGGGSSANDSKSFSVDKTPTIQVTSPPGGATLSAPFDITASATFKPTLSGTKGSISCSWGYSSSTYAYGLGSKSCTDESCSFSYAELTGRLFDLPTGSYWVQCWVYGGGSSAHDSKSFSVDKTQRDKPDGDRGGGDCM